MNQRKAIPAYGILSSASFRVLSWVCNQLVSAFPDAKYWGPDRVRPTIHEPYRT